MRLIMKIIKNGLTAIYNYTCEEIKQRICPVCKAVYEYTDSECEIVEVDNPSYLYDNLRYLSLRRNLLYMSPEFQPVRKGRAKSITCPCCSYTETFDYQMIY